MRVLILLAALLTATLTYAQDNIVLRNGEDIPGKVLEVNQTDLKYRKSGNPDGPVYTAPLRSVLFIKYANGTKDSFGSQPSPLTGSNSSVDSAPSATMPVPAAGASGFSQLRYESRFFSRYYVDTNGQHVGMKQAKSLLSAQPDALTAFDQGRSLRTWSIATAIPAVVLIGAGVGMLAGGDGMMNGERDGMKNDRGSNAANDPNDTDMNGDMNGEGHGDEAMVGAAMIGGGVLLGVASVWLNHRATVQFRRAADRFNSRPATSLRFAPASRGLGVGMTLRF